MHDEREMSFIDHLEELRWHLIRAFIAIVVFAVVAFVYKSFFFKKIILGPASLDFPTYQWLCKFGEALSSPILCIEQLTFEIQSRQMTGQFTMHITYSIIVGFICAFPYVFWEIWRFISPGLYPDERQAVRGATFFVSVLFLLGVSFGYYIISPLTVNFLGNYTLDDSILNEFDIISYVSTISTLVLASGLVFQLPIVVYFLSKAGLVTPKLMKAYRKHAVVVILILSAVITPPDLISQLLLALPLILLYQVSILISKIVLRNAGNEEESSETPMRLDQQ